MRPWESIKSEAECFIIQGIFCYRVTNAGSGHAFPTGVSDIREAWVELRASDASGGILARIGGPGADGTLPPDSARLGTDIATKDGTILYRHELAVTSRLPFDRRVLPGQTVTMTIPIPEIPPSSQK